MTHLPRVRATELTDTLTRRREVLEGEMAIVKVSKGRLPCQGTSESAAS